MWRSTTPSETEGHLCMLDTDYVSSNFTCLMSTFQCVHSTGHRKKADLACNSLAVSREQELVCESVLLGFVLFFSMKGMKQNFKTSQVMNEGAYVCL